VSTPVATIATAPSNAPAGRPIGIQLKRPTAMIA